MRAVTLATAALALSATALVAQDLAAHLAAGDAARCARNPQQALVHFREALALDSIGNLYIGDTYNQRVRKVSTSGVITTVAGSGVQGYRGDGGQAAAAALLRLWLRCQQRAGTGC